MAGSEEQVWVKENTFQMHYYEDILLILNPYYMIPSIFISNAWKINVFVVGYGGTYV